VFAEPWRLQRRLGAGRPRRYSWRRPGAELRERCRIRSRAGRVDETVRVQDERAPSGDRHSSVDPRQGEAAQGPSALDELVSEADEIKAISTASRSLDAPSNVFAASRSRGSSQNVCGPYRSVSPAHRRSSRGCDLTVGCSANALGEVISTLVPHDGGHLIWGDAAEVFAAHLAQWVQKGYRSV
jgi:hypothetical protein